MIANIISLLTRIAHSRWYWISLLVIGVMMLVVALGYQYILKEPPCVLCIHVRLWVSLLIIFSVLGFYVRKSSRLNSMVHLFMVLIAAGLTDRSYQLLGTERGFVYGDCVFDLGFPAWLAIDQWLPALYGVETSCGYTPLLLFGITMAEALMVMSVLFLVISLAVLMASFLKKDKQGA